jgi:hypothetical protein
MYLTQIESEGTAFIQPTESKGDDEVSDSTGAAVFEKSR